MAASTEKRFDISAEWLAGRSFSFRTEPSGALLSRGVVFEADGSISGYEHPNEASWRLSGGRMEVLNFEGKPTCILDGCEVDGGFRSLRGYFVHPDLPQLTTRSLHVFDENANDGRGVISTFDFFDTLIARRCHDPVEIFASVERRSGVPGFAKRRREVEMAMFGRRIYTFDDIYDQLMAEEGWTENRRKLLQMLEYTVEWENIYPIREMVAVVGPRDVIVSDMYLPAEFVRKLAVEKCGLTSNPVLVTNYGKHLGVVWPHLLARYDIHRHFGDNLHADVASPKAHGIDGRHVPVSAWSAAEEILIEAGLRPFAELLRETRLTSFVADPELRAAQAAQVNFNLPFLTLCSIFLLAKAREKGADTLLLCARDCNFLNAIMRTVVAREPSIKHMRYIAASRKLFYSGAPEYEAYFRNLMGKENLLVDIVGTGQSLCNFIHALGPDAGVTPVPLVGEPHVEGFGDVRVECLTKQDFVPLRMSLEVLNQSLNGSAVACQFNEYAFQIIRAENDYDPRFLQIIAAMESVVKTFAGLLETELRWDAPEHIDQFTQQAAAEKLFAILPQHMGAILPIADEIGRRERACTHVDRTQLTLLRTPALESSPSETVSKA